MEIEVVRSARRRKTVQAQLVDGVLRIAIPDHLSESEEAHWIEVMQSRFAGRRDPSAIDLAGRARRLAVSYALPIPSEIVWSDRQKTMWGSCTVDSGRIRISRRVAAFPRWVLDYVIVHELAHLVEPDHGAAFWELVNRYPMAERARGYLIAKGDRAGLLDDVE
jgi:predicted metal-dependent hydrolase